MDTRDKVNELWEMDSFFMSFNELLSLAKIGYQFKMEQKGYDHINTLYNERFNNENAEGTE